MLSGSCGVWLSCKDWEHVHCVIGEHYVFQPVLSFYELQWTLKLALLDLGTLKLAFVDSKMSYGDLNILAGSS